MTGVAGGAAGPLPARVGHRHVASGLYAAVPCASGTGR
jgi:hypothetical protein